MDPTKLSHEQLKQLPAMKPPAGHRTNFANPGIDGSNATEAIIGLALLTGLTVLVLCLRLYAKIVILRTTGWDDCE
jgi:hypothetical protein